MQDLDLGQLNFLATPTNAYILVMLHLEHTILLALCIALASSQNSQSDSACCKRMFCEEFAVSYLLKLVDGKFSITKMIFKLALFCEIMLIFVTMCYYFATAFQSVLNFCTKKKKQKQTMV